MTGESISVIKVRDVLMATVPSDPEDKTISELQDKVLLAMDKHKAKGLIMDISMVETMDSFFARTIAETAQMVLLMGGHTIIAGMRPSIAITSTQLGFTMGNAMTALDVDSALDMIDEHSEEY